MAVAVSQRVVPPASQRAGRFSVWFGRISRALSQQMSQYVRRELGLNLAEYRTLTMLSECMSASIRDIALGTELDKAQITRAVASMTRRGLVIHTVDGRDRRLRVVKLTPAGHALGAKSIPFVVERQNRLERTLSAGELRTVWKALHILAAEARAMEEEEAAQPAMRRKPSSRARR
jgi:DNA-binding MarR family transcriptional regulator